MAPVKLRRPPKKRRKRPTDRDQALARRDGGKLAAKSGTAKVLEPQCIVDEVDLCRVLKVHAIQSSQLADQLAKDESTMIAFVKSGPKDANAAFLLLERQERVRRSAIADVRQTVRLMEELKHPHVSLAAVLNADQRAVYASGSSKVFGRHREDVEGE